MPEIYMRKKAFWKEEKDNNRLMIVILFVVLLGITLLFLNKENKDDTVKNDKFNDNKNTLKKFKILLRIFRRLKLYEKLIFDFKTTYKNELGIINKLYNPITQSNLNEEGYWLRKFSYNIQSLKFDKCQSNILSQEIELYYNFLFNKKHFEFEIANDYADDSNVIEDKICFTSGKAHIALKTLSTPKCIEFKNLQIGNFYDSISVKNNTNILFKFHIFKVKNNKIHIYPVNKQLITSKHIKEYYETEEDDSKFPYVDRNFVIYKDSITEDKFIRICNLIPLTDSELYYDNKFWLEINWDSKIQNMICLSEFVYLF
jgi:hypothetical protein